MRLRQARMSCKYTQQQVADALGVDRVTYARYECGARQPDAKMLIKIADFFGVSTDYLLNRTDDPYFEYRPAPDTIVLSNKKEAPVDKPEPAEIIDLDLVRMMPKNPDELTEYVRSLLVEWQMISDESGQQSEKRPSGE